MKITFYGATQQVTGSMYHIQTEDGTQYLVDCGLDYEKGNRIERNAEFPFDPKQISAVFLTHAHIDHSGNLPTLYNKGFAGRVFCSEPTLALSDILLSDSAKIESNRLRKKRKGKKGEYKRLYGFKEVKDTIQNMITLTFGKRFEIQKNLIIELIPAGHILGAASVVLEVVEDGVKKRIAFSGDLGKDDNAIVGKPEIPVDIDYLVMEGTYGARRHQETRSPEEVLSQHVREVCVERKGRLIIPAFSVGRTQAILFTLHKMFREGSLPLVNVFADSPLGMNSGEIHQRFYQNLNDQAKAYAEQYGNLFAFKSLYLVEDEEDVELLKDYSKAGILVSSAGMMEGGRIQEHIIANIGNVHCRILIAGYCTPGTLGHQLLERKTTVQIRRNSYPVLAEIASTDIFSAHPDSDGLMNYALNVREKGKLKKVFLTHGEPSSLAVFQNSLQEKDFVVKVPNRGETVLV